MKQFEAGNKKFPVYVTEPTGPVKGGLIVVHEVWGLVDHIKRVADRFAAESYLVVAPDLLSDTKMDEQVGVKLQHDLFDPQTRNQAQPAMREFMAPLNAPGFADETIAKLKVCFDYLFDQAQTHQQVAVAGFCFGGTYSFSLAVAEPRLKAVVPFYGHADYGVDQLKHISCPILAFYGQQDKGLMDGLDTLKNNMQEANVDFTTQVYPDCGHAFFNDTNIFAYNQTAATDAWSRVLEFLGSNLDT